MKLDLRHAKARLYGVALAKLSKGIAILVGVAIVLASIGVFASIAAHLPAQMSLSNSSPIEGKNTSPEQIRAIVRQARDSWVNGDADAFAALFTSDGELIVPGQKWVGREAIRKAAADFANYASNVKIDIRQIIIEGDRAAVEWYWEDTQKASGRRNRADDAIIADFAAGKIKRWREYIDSKTPGNS